MLARTTTSAAIAAAFALFAALPSAQAYDYTAPVPFRTRAAFDPAAGVIPFPNNLLLSGTRDLTLNIPVANPDDLSDPKVAMNALDGFSTVAPWTATFTDAIDGGSLKGGANVRVFEVTLTGPGGAVASVVRELKSPEEFVAALSPTDTDKKTVAILPTKPLKERTSYMAVLTDGIKNAAGFGVRGGLTYALATNPNPICVNGVSQSPVLPSDRACALEPLRKLISAQEAAATTAGVPRGSIALSWTMTTQSITPTLKALTAKVMASPAAPIVAAPTGKTLGDLGIGLPPVADIHIGTLEVPYYLSAPSATNPTAALTGYWKGAPGAYLEACAGFGLDPQSTNLTACNPLPVKTSTQKIPLLYTVPNAASGRSKPASGWPVVIFQHGITRNRTDAFAVAGTLAAQGYAVVAIDLPLHGIADRANPFHVSHTPFAAAGASERTFDLDLSDNTTGAPGPDGAIDASGSYFINLKSLLTSRDNLRQGAADLLTLSKAVAGLPNADGSKVVFVGQSLGSIVGTVFLANDATVPVGVLNVPGGGIAGLLNGSATFGPRIRAGLAASGIQAGTPAFAAFLGAAQTVVDSGDSINYTGNGTLLTTGRTNAAGQALPDKRLLVQEVVGGGDVPSDQVIPNKVDGAPLSGTEPLIAALGLTAITATTQKDTGIRGAVRFIKGNHGSLLDPTASAAATVEMQGEMASMLVSGGTAVQVANPAVIVVPPPPTPTP